MAENTYDRSKPPSCISSKKLSEISEEYEHSLRKPLPFTKGSGSAGAINEKDFENAFGDVPDIEVASPAELKHHLQDIYSVLANPQGEWDKIIDALKHTRSLLRFSGKYPDELILESKKLHLPFKLLANDLRSQVVREVCITLAYMSETLGLRFEQFGVFVFMELITLTQNSAKVKATAGQIACRYILKNTPSSRLIPVIISSLASRSREIRKNSVHFIHQICCNWTVNAIEKNKTAVREAIHKTLSDADCDVRMFARKAFWSFKHQFPDQAEILFRSLEPAKQKQLINEQKQNSADPVDFMDNFQGNTRRGQFVAMSPTMDKSFDRTDFDNDETRGRFHTTPLANRAIVASVPMDSNSSSPSTSRILTPYARKTSSAKSVRFVENFSSDNDKAIEKIKKSSRSFGGTETPMLYYDDIENSSDLMNCSFRNTFRSHFQYGSRSFDEVIVSRNGKIVDTADSSPDVHKHAAKDRLNVHKPKVMEGRETQCHIIKEALAELSCYNQRNPQRKKTMTALRHMVRDGTFTLWTEYFESILLVLLETLNDHDRKVRVAALRLLSEICLSQTRRLYDFADLTVLKILRSYDDDDRDIASAVDECASILATQLPPLLSLRILKSVTRMENCKFLVLAAKMRTKAVERLTLTDAELIIGDLLPEITEGFEHPNLPIVRKESLSALVALHKLIGREKLLPYVNCLSKNKIRLLKLYLQDGETNSPGHR